MDRLNLIRKHYQKASVDLEELEDLWDLVKDYSLEDSPLFFAYKAAARALQAKDSWIPHTKWSYIKEAMLMFRQVIERNPDHIEIRFLRFSVQHNTPEILELSEDIEEDTARISQHLPQFSLFNLEPSHAAFILKFLEESKRLDPSIIEELKKKIPPSPESL